MRSRRRVHSPSRQIALLASALLLAGGTGCAVVRLPDAVIDGVDLPAELSLVLRKGMSEMEVIARFGAPAERTRLGGFSSMLYNEVYRPEHNRVELFGFRVNPDPTIRTQLRLVFQDRALTQAWVEESRSGQQPVKRWIVGGPAEEGAESRRRHPPHGHVALSLAAAATPFTPSNP